MSTTSTCVFIRFGVSLYRSQRSFLSIFSCAFRHTFLRTVCFSDHALLFYLLSSAVFFCFNFSLVCVFCIFCLLVFFAVPLVSLSWLAPAVCICWNTSPRDYKRTHRHRHMQRALRQTRRTADQHEGGGHTHRTADRQAKRQHRHRASRQSSPLAPRLPPLLPLCPTCHPLTLRSSALLSQAQHKFW